VHVSNECETEVGKAGSACESVSNECEKGVGEAGNACESVSNECEKGVGEAGSEQCERSCSGPKGKY
jgi:hypothetical protein